MTEPQIQRFIEGVISVTDSPANSKKLGKCAGILGDTLRELVQRRICFKIMVVQIGIVSNKEEKYMDSVFFDDVFVGLFDQCQVREELSSRFLSKLRRCEDWIRVLFFWPASGFGCCCLRFYNNNNNNNNKYLEHHTKSRCSYR